VAVWILAGVALLVALGALGAVRRLSRRLDALNQAYWELRYDYTRLRSRLAQVAPDPASPAADPPQPVSAAVSFVPLSAIGKKDQ
jgi:hypothetical protein